MISLWRMTLDPTDLRVELRDGNFAMGRFDNRADALDWLGQHVADEEERIDKQLSEIADEQKDVQEMREFWRTANDLTSDDVDAECPMCGDSPGSHAYCVFHNVMLPTYTLSRDKNG